MSSTNSGSTLIFASCVVGTCNIDYYYVGKLFLNGRGPILLFKYTPYIYNKILYATEPKKLGVITLIVFFWLDLSPKHA